MASHLYRTRAILQIPRCVSTLIARGQSTQSTPSAGQGIPPAGNFNSATSPNATGSSTTGGQLPPIGSSSTSGSKTPPFGDPAINQSFMNTPMGKAGAVAVLSIALYAGYKMLSGKKEESKDPKDKKDKKDGKDQKNDEQNKQPGGGGGDQQAGKGKDAKK